MKLQEFITDAKIRSKAACGQIEPSPIAMRIRAKQALMDPASYIS